MYPSWRSTHAATGYEKGDADLILAYGTQVAAETWFLSNRDVHREIEARKREIQALERLRNRKGRRVRHKPRDNPSVTVSGSETCIEESQAAGVDGMRAAPTPGAAGQPLRCVCARFRRGRSPRAACCRAASRSS